MRTARRSVPFVIALVAVVLVALPSLAAAEKGWKFLGERTVTDGAEHDSITVTAAEGDLTALQVRVKMHAVQFRSMKVHFANGEAQEIELRDVIPAGGASRVIDLSGGDRVVRSVEFRYDAQTVRGKQALVRLFGRR
jgi:hypothetical protein